MTYRDRARAGAELRAQARAQKLTPLEIRSANVWTERPAIVPTAVYTVEEAALVMALSAATVSNARRGEGEKQLRCMQIGTSVRFLGEELLRWLKAHEVPAEQE